MQQARREYPVAACQDGKGAQFHCQPSAIWKGKKTVSADGKTLTEESSFIGVNEPAMAVYDKVS
ncbi:hypothetical protein H7849_20715 [Alloacidobacterium dinghuense]|uniref:Uncharacterized protein n=1 Tax=Alloacidobacterium dinghuense TaxID=2763107 RepID=A0A7G8BG03_9BACT|nr:hypothetical protein [Alloacidobacterium dinghuense]QNI31473.1 hypothetical protein H7849_20715 [Alloacidobacterium dinghuense]